MIYIVLLIVIGLIIGILINQFGSKESAEENNSENTPDDCCGAHEVCESDSLLNASEEIIYYDDDELDAYKNRACDEYSDDEIEQFREVLYTLKEYEVAGWLKSLQLRTINPPDIVKEEALMIVADRREKGEMEKG